MNRWMKAAIVGLAFGLSAVSKTARAEEVRYLAHSYQSLAALVQLIQSAKKSIDMSYFIFEPCHLSTRVLADALAERAAQGVKVRVIVDAFLHDKDMRRDFTAWFARRGVDLRYYNAAFVLNPGTNLRNHIKLTVVDAEAYITGGRNLGDDYFGLAVKNYLDRDVLVRGASARDARASFEELWKHSNVSKARTAGADLARFAQKCNVKPSQVERIKANLAARGTEYINATPVRQCPHVIFRTDNPSFSNLDYSDIHTPESGPTEYMSPARMKQKRATDVTVTMFKSTRKSLEIENWAYIPRGEIDVALADLRARRIPVMVITNGAAGAGSGLDDVFDSVVRRFSRRDSVGSQKVLQIARQGSLNDNWEMSRPDVGPWKIHSKVAVVDGVHPIVSSFNIDPRSYHTNLESVMVAPGCAGLAQDLQQGFKTLLEAARRDKDCATCNVPLKAGPLDKILGWLGMEFM